MGMAKYCHDCLHYEVCRLLIGEREVHIIDIACHFAEQCGGHKNKADYAEVVRCKDCKNYCKVDTLKGKILDFHWCNKFRNITKEDDFCSYGERREGE